MARIFISHSSEDDLHASALRDWLLNNGWSGEDLFLDLDRSSGIAPGMKWKQALRDAAHRCEAVICLISPSWIDSEWCRDEYRLAEHLGKRLFPLVVVPVEEKTARRYILGDFQSVKLYENPEDGYARLLTGLHRANLHSNSFSFEAGRRPYPGLQPLTEEDAAIFFGREAEIILGIDKIRLLRSLGGGRLMVILGSSGSGKSSFLRAGLLPRLIRDHRSFFPIPVIRPERAAIGGALGLAKSLEKTLSQLVVNRQLIASAQPITQGAIAEAITTEDTGLSKILQVISASLSPAKGQGGEVHPPSIVLPIDQGEELFNAQGEEEAHQFLEMLATSLRQEPNVIAIMTIRSDSYPKLQAEPRIPPNLHEPFNLSPISIASFRAIIEGPAELVKPKPLRIDPLLTQALLQDSHGADALPLLAFTMQRLFLAYGSDGNLTVNEYEKIGRISGALRLAIENVVEAGQADRRLPDDRKELEQLLRSVFIPHLVWLDEKGEYTRRVAQRTSIPKEAQPLVDMLVEQRLLLTDQRHDSTEDQQIVEIAHEALLREWPLLVEWLEEERDFLRGLGQLEYEVDEYKSLPDTDKSNILWTGLKLARARDWIDKRRNDIPDHALPFVLASIDQGDKKVQRARRWTRIKWGSIAGLVFVGVLGTIPTAINIYKSFKYGVSVSQVAHAEEQKELWIKNLRCVQNLQFTTRKLDDGSVVKTGVCVNTGDVLIETTTPGGATPVSEWVRAEDAANYLKRLK